MWVLFLILVFAYLTAGVIDHLINIYKFLTAGNKVDRYEEYKKKKLEE